MKLIAGYFMMLLLSGCGTLGDVVQTGREANDTAVDAAIFTLCEGASVGSIRREFGARANDWEALCDDGFSILDMESLTR